MENKDTDTCSQRTLSIDHIRWYASDIEKYFDRGGLVLQRSIQYGNANEGI